MNVVVFCSDTFRFDHLGGLGAQPVQTPNLDKLVQESALFTDYRLCSFPTVLNRIEVFSGRYTFPVIGWGAQPYQYPVLAEAFSHHGYHTALISDNPHIIRKGFGFERGFGYVDKILGQTDDEFLPESAPMAELPCPLEKLEPRESRLERYRRNAQFFQQQGSSTTEVVARSTIKWLKAQPNPFFLWVDAFDPHEPWNAPSRYLEKYPWNAEGDMVVWPRDGKTDRYTQADVANMQSLYKAEITQTDYWLGELMGELRDSKTLENTIVI